MERFKREMGSITVVVFATVTFILIILSTIYATISQKRKSQAIELQELKEAYDIDMDQAFEERSSNKELQRIMANGKWIAVPSGVEGLKEHYGETVNSFGRVAEVEWQLFYDDEDYYYLIASDYVQGNYLPSDLQHGGSSYPYHAWFYSNVQGNSSSAFLNSGKWPQGASLIKDSKYIKWVNQYPSSTKKPIRAVAYMLDNSIWADFTRNIDGAKATGGPTLEMFIKSYNAAHTTNRLTEINQFNSTNSDEYGYKQTYSGLNASSDNMWIIKTTTKAEGYWIAYPYGDKDIMKIYYANSNGEVISSRIDEEFNDCGFRPLVAIPKNN